MITILWGVFCIGTALLLNESTQAARQTTIVLINAVGSMLYGPILAAFILGMLSRRINPNAIKKGIVFGIIGNVLLWIFTSVSWMWWNVSGFITTAVLSHILSLGAKPSGSKSDLKQTGESKDTKVWRPVYSWIFAYFFLIIFLSLWLEI